MNKIKKTFGREVRGGGCLGVVLRNIFLDMLFLLYKVTCCRDNRLYICVIQHAHNL